jgi:uncharacterized membrane protein
MRKSFWSNRLPLMLILLGGTALRLFHLGAESLWYDETVSVALAGSPLPELIRHTAGDIHPPGYYILLRGWLGLMGYPAGRAAPGGNGLEFAGGFLSLFCGVALIALIYALARRALRGRVDGRSAALVAAALAACSPYNVWYSQEVRMYTLGASLGVVALYALWRALTPLERRTGFWWIVYVLAAAAGMYTLYYFAFLLVALNVWALVGLGTRYWGLGTRSGRAEIGTHSAPQTTQPKPPSQPQSGAKAAGRPPHPTLAWLVANLAAAVLYSPWIPVAFRQATQPPVPPWRTMPALLAALQEGWTALTLGQSAPAWGWPVLMIAAALYIMGLVAIRRTRTRHPEAGSLPLTHRTTGQVVGSGRCIAACPPYPALALGLATFGSLALILLVSFITPLYHVRYLFTYSPAFYVTLAAGLLWLWTRRPRISARAAAAAAAVCGALWLGAAGVSLRDFWTAPAYRTDDLRGAVRFLQARWRPGDVLVVNAGYAYTALQTYWDGPIAARARLTDDLPTPRTDAALVMLTTGHVDGAPGLGWGDPRSDFFAMSAAAARSQLKALFGRFTRIWQFRIYDTVNDPAGVTRAALAQDGQLFEDQSFTGEANMRVQGFLTLPPAPGGPSASAPVTGGARFGNGLSMASAGISGTVEAGQTIYAPLRWQISQPLEADFATSIRLVGPDGVVWAQPPDERPAGPQFPAHAWPADAVVPQTLALPVPLGTAPGIYTVALVVYDPASGKPWQIADLTGALSAGPGEAVTLGQINVVRPAAPPITQPALATFGPLALVAADSPASTLSPGGSIPLALTWQAAAAPGEPLIVVAQLLDERGDVAAGLEAQLLDERGDVAAGLEAQPLDGRYPTQGWTKGEIVRDRHTLSVPATLLAGRYHLVVGVYRAQDRARLQTQTGLFSKSPYYVVKTIAIKP